LHERQHGGAVGHAVGHWDVDGHNKALHVAENDTFMGEEKEDSWAHVWCSRAPWLRYRGVRDRRLRLQ
jgi:hypothetical protein